MGEGRMNVTEAADELKQRAAWLLNRAMDESQISASELARKLTLDGNTTNCQKQLRRISKGEVLPNLTTLFKILDECGFDLVISMKRKPEAEEESDFG